MRITLHTPTPAHLEQVVSTLATWQRDDATFQLHPGDIGWFWRKGAHATAAALRTWSRDGDLLLAVGLRDEEDLLRLALAPEVLGDAAVAEQLVADIVDPERGVLPAGTVTLELPTDAAAHAALEEQGWSLVDPWAIMRHDLTTVADHDLRIEVIDAASAAVWAQVHCAAWGGDPEDEPAVEARWQQMASGIPFAQARCLVGFDADDRPVATVTVWSAGPGRPGIIEPMGVDPAHRGRGHGRSMNIAAAAALRDLGCSAGFVATTGSNTGAVAAYESAGFATINERLDRQRQG